MHVPSSISPFFLRIVLIDSWNRACVCHLLYQCFCVSCAKQQLDWHMSEHCKVSIACTARSMCGLRNPYIAAVRLAVCIQPYRFDVTRPNCISNTQYCTVQSIRSFAPKTAVPPPDLPGRGTAAAGCTPFFKPAGSEQYVAMRAGHSVVVKGWNLEETAFLPPDAGGQEMPRVLYALQGGQHRADRLHVQWAAEDVRFPPVPQLVPRNFIMH